VDAVQEGANLIGMSALLTTTMSNMGATIEALKAAGLRDQVKVMIGGAPVTEEFAKSIGADAFAPMPPAPPALHAWLHKSHNKR
jgi:5-methyltetrahydrofolate--homocysteine methyltransferase